MELGREGVAAGPVSEELAGRVRVPFRWCLAPSAQRREDHDVRIARGKVGVFGSCSGGRHAFIYACQKKDVDACVEQWGGGVVMAVVALGYGVLVQGSPWYPINVLAGIAISALSHGRRGSPLDLIQSWIEVEVKDETGRVVFSSGKPDEKRMIPPGTFLFKAEPVDRYGNLVTDVPAGWLPAGPCRAEVGGHAIPGDVGEPGRSALDLALRGAGEDFCVGRETMGSQYRQALVARRQQAFEQGHIDARARAIGGQRALQR